MTFPPCFNSTLAVESCPPENNTVCAWIPTFCVLCCVCHVMCACVRAPINRRDAMFLSTKEQGSSLKGRFVLGCADTYQDRSHVWHCTWRRRHRQRQQKLAQVQSQTGSSPPPPHNGSKTFQTSPFCIHINCQHS